MIFKLVDVTYEETESAWVANAVKALVKDALPEEYVDSERPHIAYSYAYAARLQMRRADGSKFKGKLSAVEIQDLFKLGTAGIAEVEKDDTLTFEASDKEHIAFASKSARLHRENGLFKFFPEEVQTRGFATPQQADSAEAYIPSRGMVLTVEDRSPPSGDR